MKRYKLAVVFTQPPFGTASAREGLDVLLAASAFCEEDEIAAIFLFDGVYNLVVNQQPEVILQKDHISAFKLLSLYDIHECFVCRESLTERSLTDGLFVLPDIHRYSQPQIFELLAQVEKVITV